MDYPKFIVANQKEESSTQRVKSGKFLRNIYRVSDNLIYKMEWMDWCNEWYYLIPLPQLQWTVHKNVRVIWDFPNHVHDNLTYLRFPSENTSSSFPLWIWDCLYLYLILQENKNNLCHEKQNFYNSFKWNLLWINVFLAGFAFR